MNFRTFTIKILLFISISIISSCESEIVSTAGIIVNTSKTDFEDAIVVLNSKGINSASRIEKNGDLLVKLSWQPLPFANYYMVYRDTRLEGDNQKLISSKIYLDKGKEEVYFEDRLNEGTFNRTRYYWLEACALELGCVRIKEPKEIAWKTDVPEKIVATVYRDKNAKKQDVKLSWIITSSSDFSEIYRALSSDFKESLLIKKLNKRDSNSFTDTDVAPSKYYYWVKSCNSAGCSKESPSADIIVGNPSNVEIKAIVESGVVNISWSPDSSSTYSIFRGKNNALDDNTTLIFESNDVSKNSYNDKVSPGTYHYWIKKCDGLVCTDGGSGIKVNVLDKPSIKEVKLEDGDVVLMVNKPSNYSLSKEVFTYIYRGTKNTFIDAKKIATLSGNDVSYRDAVDVDNYYYWAQSCNYSGCTEVVSLGGAVSVIAEPKSKPDLSIVNGTIVIKSNSTEKGADFSIYRGENTDLYSATKIGDLASGNKDGYKDTSVSNPGDYYYWFKSCGSLGCSKAAGPSKISFLGRVLSQIKSSVENGEAVLSWDKVKFGTKLSIYRSTTKDDTSSLKKISEGIKADSTSYTDSTVAGGFEYYYWLQSCDNSNACSGYSNASNKTLIPVEVSSAPITSQDDGIPIIKTDGTQLNLNFKIYRGATSNLNDANEIGEMQSGSKEGYKDTSVTNSGDYYYWFRNCTISGCSKMKGYGKVTVVPRPTKPSNIKAINDASTGKIKVSWKSTKTNLYSEVYRATSADLSDAKKIYVTAPGAMSYEDGVVKGGVYYYSVKLCLETRCSSKSLPSSAVTAITRPDVKLGLGGDSYIRFGESRIKINEKTTKPYSIFKSVTNDIYTAKYAGKVSDTIGNQGVVSDGETYYFWVKDCNSDRSICSLPSIRSADSDNLAIKIPDASKATLEVANVDKSSGKVTIDVKNYSNSVYAWASKTRDFFSIPNPTVSSFNNNSVQVDANKHNYMFLTNCRISSLCSSASQITNVSILVNNLPATRLIADVVGNRVELNWDSVKGSVFYNIYKNNTNDYSNSTVLVSPLASTTLFKTTINSPGIYYYWVQSCMDSYNCSEASNVVVVSTSRLNDTALSTSSSSSSSIFARKCSSTTLKQDCSYGRDVKYPDNSNGILGYDFTKLDKSGNTLRNSAKEWSCIRDNVSGLVWESKKADLGSVHNNHNEYEWNKWDSLVESSNSNQLCGFNDWRVPDANELVNMMNLKSENIIDHNFFPLVINNPGINFWSSTKVLKKDGDKAISVSPGAIMGVYDTTNKERVWLVRGPRSFYWGNGRYRIRSDGTATDIITGLTWKRCSEGQTFSNNTCVGSKQKLSFDESLIRAENSDFAGKNNWRVPNYKELASLVDFNKFSNSSAAAQLENNNNQTVFPDLSGIYSSSTPRYWVMDIKGIWFNAIKNYKDNTFINIELDIKSKNNIILVHD